MSTASNSLNLVHPYDKFERKFNECIKALWTKIAEHRLHGVINVENSSSREFQVELDMCSEIVVFRAVIQIAGKDYRLHHRLSNYRDDYNLFMFPGSSEDAIEILDREGHFTPQFMIFVSHQEIKKELQNVKN